MGINKYVVGLLFSESKSKVVLIKKKKPQEQNGKVNGVGGKINFKETINAAICREFYEETGLKTSESQWIKCAERVNHKGEKVFFLKGVSNSIYNVVTMEEEEVFIADTDNLPENIMADLVKIIQKSLE